MHGGAVVSALLLLTTGALASPPAAAPTPASASSAPELTWQVVDRRHHDETAFTEGLTFDSGGRLFESTGLYGSSSVRELDASSGQVIRELRLPDDRFGEGLAAVGDELVQLTWRSGEAYLWNAGTFEPAGSFTYAGEGWGLCYDGDRLVMSDGSDRLTFRDPTTFEVVGSVAVTRDGEPVVNLNELECVAGQVWANVWLTSEIVRIDPVDGRVTASLDLSTVLEPSPALQNADDVLNGIAYDQATDTYLVTGKRWPELIEIDVLDAPAA